MITFAKVFSILQFALVLIFGIGFTMTYPSEQSAMILFASTYGSLLIMLLIYLIAKITENSSCSRRC